VGALAAGVVVCTISLGKDLQREMSRLRTARENEEDVDRQYMENRDKNLNHRRKEEQLEGLITQAVEGCCLSGKGCKFVTTNKWGEFPAPPAELNFSKGIVPQAQVRVIMTHEETYQSRLSSNLASTQRRAVKSQESPACRRLRHQSVNPA